MFWRAGLGLVAVASLIMSIVFFLQMKPLEKDLLIQSGHSTVSLQAAFTQEKAKSIVESWDENQKLIAKKSLQIDFIFIFLGYGLLMLTIGFIFPSRSLISFSILAMGFDCLENFMHLNMIATQKYFLAFPAALCSVAKFFFIGIFLFTILVVAYRVVLKKIMLHS